MDNEVEPNIEVNPDDDHNDHNDHNVENMIDANEDEVDEDEDDDDSANNDERPRDDNNGALDGGSAEGLTIHSSDCAMKLYFQCEDIFSSSIPRGTVVSIGLEKTTKLAAIFERFCVFVSTYRHKEGLDNIASIRLHSKDLEFVHCSILNPSDTVETSALMKEDYIKVYRNQVKKRKLEVEWAKEKRDSDRNYFQQIRTLLMKDLNASPLKTDVIFHCTGKITDEHGYKQEVLSPFVRGNTAMIAKRCSWLARRIQNAKESKEMSRRNIMHNMVQDNHPNVAMVENNDGNDVVQIPETDGLDISWSLNNNNGGIVVPDVRNLANAVEDEDEDENHLYQNNNKAADLSQYSRAIGTDGIRPASPIISFVGTHACNTLHVILMHPPEAVKLLLEYCYTNRVIPLGYKAFHYSFRPIDRNLISKGLREYSGPIPPYTKATWPNKGLPSINLSVALAGINLAEEAKLSRLSLMCEIAASQLVASASVLQALALCEEQRRRTGNNLKYLRKAIMSQIILAHGSRGINELSSMPSFKRTLLEKSDVVVPSLMMGLLETIKGDKKCSKSIDGSKISRSERTTHHFDELDHDDRSRRDLERQKRRKERWTNRSRQQPTVNPYALETHQLSLNSRIINDDMDFWSEEITGLLKNRKGFLERKGFLG